MMKQVYITSTVNMFLGDCLKIMPDLPEFDFIWADPPYNVGKDYHNHNDSMDHEEYISFIAEFISLASKVSKSFALYPPKIHLREFWNMLPDHHLLILGYSPAGPRRSNYFHQYVPILVPPKPVKTVPDFWFNVELPSMGWYFHEERFDHPAQTSLDLTKRILNAFTLPGHTVLDPFAGTGTTAIACMELDRKCTLIEKSSEYFNLAYDRIYKFSLQGNLFESLVPNT
jgi:site-specific DNA-methyltransferase (adenine-specific)